MPKHLSMKDARLIKKHFYILKTLGSVSKKHRLDILKNAPNSLFKVLNVIFNHCITGVIPLDTKNRKKYKTLLKPNRSKSISAIKGRLIQDGGAFPALLVGLIPIIGSLLSKLF
jgi:hypothetical protein